MKISELYGIDIYGNDARYVGKVNDIILNLETGKIVRLTTEPLRAVNKEKAKRVLKEKSVLYKNVDAVGDIIIVGKGGMSSASEGMLKDVEKRDEKATPKKRSLLGRIK